MVEKLESQINFSEVIQESTANLDDLQQDVYRLVKKLRKKNQIRKHIRKDAEERKGESGSEFIEKMNEGIEGFWKRKSVETEKYKDWHKDVIKTIYEDGSWSIERWSIEGNEFFEHEYTEYYPNSNNKKFERFRGHEKNYVRGRDEIYAIYDDHWKILFYEIMEGEGYDINPDKYQAKFDENKRLIYLDDAEYKYDDVNKKVTEIKKIHVVGEPNRVVKRISVYEMGEDDWPTDLLSCNFIWETGEKVDLMNGWIENLIEDMHLEDVPHIYSYNNDINLHF